MNKKEFITKLSETTGYKLEECKIVNDILESHFFPSNKEKEQIIEKFVHQLNISEKDASNLYDQALGIIKNEIKNKLKHPFKSQD